MKLDIGCGKNKKDGFLGVDILSLPGVDKVFDVRKGTWPWEDGSVEEIHCSHFIEHLTNLDGKFERVHFFNEAWRVLQPEGKLSLIFPHWSSHRYYGDPTHCEVISEMAFYYLSRDWRKGQAPHTDAEMTDNPRLYWCNFECSWGFVLHPEIQLRNPEYQQHALKFWKEAAQDTLATLVKKS